MNINATLLGETIIIMAVVTGIICYLLAKRKVRHPREAGLIGFVLSFIPPLGLIYLAFLSLKNDLVKSDGG